MLQLLLFFFVASRRTWIGLQLFLFFVVSLAFLLRLGRQGVWVMDKTAFLTSCARACDEEAALLRRGSRSSGGSGSGSFLSIGFVSCLAVAFSGGGSGSGSFLSLGFVSCLAVAFCWNPIVQTRAAISSGL